MVPSNLFEFTAGKSIAISGVVNMRLVGSNRKLRALVGDAAPNVDGNEAAAYKIEVNLKDTAELDPKDEAPTSNSGTTQASELAILGMLVLASYVML